MTRRIRGRTAHEAGQAAEDQVARHYAQGGHRITHRRWRGPGGEIDLIARDGSTLCFVEVKKSRDFGAAAARVTPRQKARICASAEAFLAGEPAGALTDMRIDVALVNARGEVRVIENAVMAA